MTETAFTPGPWKVRFGNGINVDWMEGIQGSPDEGEQYGEMVVNRGIAKPKSERGIANAHLIASAPDLFEALELADAMLCGANMNQKAVERKVKAALSKALGRAA